MGVNRHLIGETYGLFHNATKRFTLQQTDAELVAAPGSGKHLYLTDVIIICNAAVDVLIEAGGSTILVEHYGDAQGSGLAHTYHANIKLAANTAITLTTSAAVKVFVHVGGYIAGDRA
jgi:hypothetical protein